MFFRDYFQPVLAESGSGNKPVLHSIAGANTIWIVTSFYTVSILEGGLKKSNSNNSVIKTRYFGGWSMQTIQTVCVTTHKLERSTENLVLLRNVGKVKLSLETEMVPQIQIMLRNIKFWQW